jgi:hypothetical protein
MHANLALYKYEKLLRTFTVLKLKQLHNQLYVNIYSISSQSKRKKEGSNHVIYVLDSCILFVMRYSSFEEYILVTIIIVVSERKKINWGLLY